MDRVGVFGTGVMARGIAALCLERGFDVVLASGSTQRAEALRAQLSDEAPGGDVSADPSDLGACSLIVEATVEDLETKGAVLRDIEAGVGAEVVLATTTSALSITELAAGLGRPEMFVGVHFFNPVRKMRLVEVVAGLATGPDAIARCRAFAEALGKVPLTVPDRAGFLVNRLLIPYLNQAARLVERGGASVEEVDQAKVLGAGHPMGPFALIDLIGVDVCVAIGRSLYEEYHRTADAPTHELTSRAVAGFLGRKTGKGYYEYPPKDEGD
jgi:3-hydroxybutyryl-CoA dehydrogenase